MDWDLQPEQTFVLRAPGQDFALKVTGAHDVKSAAVRLLSAIEENLPVWKVLTEHGFKLGDPTKEMGAAITRGFHIRVDNSQGERRILWQPESPDLANGFRALVQALLLASRKDRSFHNLLTKLGILPLLP